MSRGRYHLLRADIPLDGKSTGGLDLDVIDDYCGDLRLEEGSRGDLQITLYGYFFSDTAILRKQDGRIFFKGRKIPSRF